MDKEKYLIYRKVAIHVIKIKGNCIHNPMCSKCPLSIFNSRNSILIETCKNSMENLEFFIEFIKENDKKFLGSGITAKIESI